MDEERHRREVHEIRAHIDDGSDEVDCSEDTTDTSEMEREDG